MKLTATDGAARSAAGETSGLQYPSGRSPPCSPPFGQAFHDSRPERDPFSHSRVADVARRRVDHHELRPRVHEHALPAQPPQHELALLAGQNPCLLAVAKERARLPGLELLRRRCGRRAHPAGGDDLPSVERAVVREQHAEPRVIPNRGVNAEISRLVAALVAVRQHIFPYANLASTPFISSLEKARKVWVRTLPAAPMANPSAVIDTSSGASNT